MVDVRPRASVVKPKKKKQKQNIITMIFGGKIHSKTFQVNKRGNNKAMWLAWGSVSITDTEFKSYKNNGVSTPGLCTLVMAIRRSWGPKDCLPTSTFCSLLYAVLLRLVVNTSRQCSKNICTDRHLSHLRQSRKCLCDEKFLNREGDAARLDLTLKLAVAQVRQAAALIHRWSSLFANETETTLLPLCYLLTNTM